MTARLAALPLLIIAAGCCFVTHAYAQLLGTYWQCSVFDASGKEWVEQSGYQLAAINRAFDACKKQSMNPDTCKSSKADCDAFVNGHSTRPLFQCTALDHLATPWRSNLYPQRDDAALAAKAFCQQSGGSPDTCYVNVITCKNINAPDN